MDNTELSSNPEVSSGSSLSSLVEAAPQGAADPFNTDELNEAAQMFGDLMPKIKGLARNLNRNALSRVYSSIVEFPLGERYPKFDNKQESELFILSLSAIAYKTKMMNAVADIQREKDNNNETVEENKNVSEQ